MKSIVLCLVAVVLLQLTTEGEGVCCRGKGPLWNSRCADCSKGTPYCAHGRSCNVFGCNCEGGCREGPCPPPHHAPETPQHYGDYAHSGGDSAYSGSDDSAYSADDSAYPADVSDYPGSDSSVETPETTPKDVIASADENGDGYMDVDEAASYLTKRGLPTPGRRLRRSLQDLDLNGDNFITEDEIDGYA